MADRLDFEIDVELETGLITGHAGVPGLIEAFRQTRTAAVIDREIKLKSRKRGLSVSEMVESLLAMWAAGGERAEDLDQFRQDKAVALLLGHDLPAAQTARDFLAQFHAEDLPLLQEGKAPVAAETVPLLGLAKANAELVLDLQCRRPVKTATLDVDATVIHCDKRAAKRSYDGNRGYQPVLALWAGSRLCKPRSHFLDQPADVFGLDQPHRRRAAVVEITRDREVAMAEMQLKAGRVMGVHPFLEVSAPLGSGYGRNSSRSSSRYKKKILTPRRDGDTSA